MYQIKIISKRDCCPPCQIQWDTKPKGRTRIKKVLRKQEQSALSKGLELPFVCARDTGLKLGFFRHRCATGGRRRQETQPLQCIYLDQTSSTLWTQFGELGEDKEWCWQNECPQTGGCRAQSLQDLALIEDPIGDHQLGTTLQRGHLQRTWGPLHHRDHVLCKSLVRLDAIPPQARHKSQRIPNWNCVSSANRWPQHPN